MANWNLPGLTDLYTNFLTYISNRLNDAVMMLDSISTTPLNLPTGAKRWNATNGKWEKWTGSAWVDMATSNLYGINISGNAATATNADTLDGQHGAYYQPTATAITTSNIGAQSVTNSAQLGGQAASYYQPASTAITITNIASQNVAHAATADTLVGAQYVFGNISMTTDNM